MTGLPVLIHLTNEKSKKKKANPDSEKFKLDTLAFIIGILTCLLLPYSLLLLFVKKKHFRGSLAWGWLAGWVLILLIALLIFIGPEFMFLY